MSPGLVIWRAMWYDIIRCIVSYGAGFGGLSMNDMPNLE